MDTDESIRSSSRKIKFIAVAIPCLLVLYVLSIGPVAKLDDYGYITEGASRVLGVIYAPLPLLSPIPGADKFFKWYIFNFWSCDNMGDTTL
jgi:hypothetical protein